MDVAARASNVRHAKHTLVFVRDAQCVRANGWRTCELLLQRSVDFVFGATHKLAVAKHVLDERYLGLDVTRHDFIQIFVLFAVDNERRSKAEIGHPRAFVTLSDVNVLVNVVVHFHRARQVTHTLATRADDHLADVGILELVLRGDGVNVLKVRVINVALDECWLLLLRSRLLLGREFTVLDLHAIVRIAFTRVHVLFPQRGFRRLQRPAATHELHGEIVNINAIHGHAGGNDLTGLDLFLQTVDVVVADVALVDVTNQSTVERAHGARLATIAWAFNLLHRTVNQFALRQRLRGFASEQRKQVLRREGHPWWADFLERVPHLHANFAHDFKQLAHARFGFQISGVIFQNQRRHLGFPRLGLKALLD
mmetsp:Transcript_7624/g.17108  ORF Transcript_7624/g.17108 Transcript_7624/m.17108 type:complete len:367 (+) Transcript_7624:240-1340(+)